MLPYQIGLDMNVLSIVAKFCDKVLHIILHDHIEINTNEDVDFEFHRIMKSIYSGI
jgi:hypothetical protein